MIKKLQLLFFAFIISSPIFSQIKYYVATDGSDSNNGSINNPWATVRHGLDNIADTDTIIVKPGTYNMQMRLRGSFSSGVVVKSEIPYMAKFRDNRAVVIAYTDARGCNGITIDGFDIAHNSSSASALVLHIDGNGDNSVHDITVQNCILHDSYNNDIAKINNACYNITIQGNLFFNQEGSDEHIDGNSVENLIIQDNIFMNDFASSGRTNNNSTSSYIVIKDSGGNNDVYLGSRNVKIRRNVFLNWEGSLGSNYILLGEDGNPYYEAFDVTIENNLLLGNSSNTMRAPLGLKGVRDVTFRNNTITGNLPANAFAIRSNRESDNLINDNIYLYNNIWSDPTGSMNDFSDTPINHTDNFVLDNNLYWNNGASIPTDSNDVINFSDDNNQITSNPFLGSLSGLELPHFNSSNNQFNDGSISIREAFVKLVNLYGTPSETSLAINNANASNASSEDILKKTRTHPDIGAVEYQTALSTSSESLKDNILVYPNPVLNKMNLVFNNEITGDVKLSLFTLDGKLIKTKTAIKTSNKLASFYDASLLKSGIYILKIENNKNIYQYKIVKH